MKKCDHIFRSVGGGLERCVCYCGATRNEATGEIREDREGLLRHSIPASFVPSHMVTEHSPQGICDICGHPYVGMALDCACTGSPTRKLISVGGGRRSLLEAHRRGYTRRERKDTWKPWSKMLVVVLHSGREVDLTWAFWGLVAGGLWLWLG